jgi:hypothetical protein
VPEDFLWLIAQCLVSLRVTVDRAIKIDLHIPKIRAAIGAKAFHFDNDLRAVRAICNLINENAYATLADDVAVGINTRIALSSNGES